jgi:NTE family protein
VLLVLLNPLKREGTPRSVEEIEARVLELGFSANFMREMRMFAQATSFSKSQTPWKRGSLERRLQAMRFHMIDSSQLQSLQSSDTKLLAHGPFLDLLHLQGHNCATAWLAKNADKVGDQSAIDLEKYFL